jgi:hypothetical protein
MTLFFVDGRQHTTELDLGVEVKLVGKTRRLRGGCLPAQAGSRGEVQARAGRNRRGCGATRKLTPWEQWASPHPRRKVSYEFDRRVSTQSLLPRYRAIHTTVHSLAHCSFPFDDRQPKARTGPDARHLRIPPVSSASFSRKRRGTKRSLPVRLVCSAIRTVCTTLKRR